ncbi:peptidoglycan-binding domain-containing protein [Wenxinia saemankumensis]|uniref:peptidoglycan-binding domain-containing protein n=1 Tax=Wenxinia saemankumensis TaxID=1447782 RepID=UPI0009FAB75F
MVGNRLRCDLGSRSVECGNGAPSSGTAAPFRAQPSSVVVGYQQQLLRHCAGLPADFADGFEGPATINALMRFQRSAGLNPDGVFGSDTAAALSGPVTGACR